jgi:hypothetical protein
MARQSVRLRLQAGRNRGAAPESFAQQQKNFRLSRTLERQRSLGSPSSFEQCRRPSETGRQDRGSALLRRGCTAGGSHLMLSTFANVNSLIRELASARSLASGSHERRNRNGGGALVDLRVRATRNRGDLSPYADPRCPRPRMSSQPRTTCKHITQRLYGADASGRAPAVPAAHSERCDEVDNLVSQPPIGGADVHGHGIVVVA